MGSYLSSQELSPEDHQKHLDELENKLVKDGHYCVEQIDRYEYQKDVGIKGFEKTKKQLLWCGKKKCRYQTKNFSHL